VKSNKSPYIFLALICAGVGGALWWLFYSEMSNLGPMRFKARQEIRMLTSLCRMYYTEYGSSPGVSHVAIVAALGGQNPREITFSTFDDVNLNSGGMILDPWGSPYQFDTRDPSHPTVWSLGPNRTDDFDDIRDSAVQSRTNESSQSLRSSLRSSLRDC
jgi:hypothetical protein